MVNKAFISTSLCKKQINKQNSYLLLAFLQSGSVPELDMHESKHYLPGQFVHSEIGIETKSSNYSYLFNIIKKIQFKYLKFHL